MDYLIEHVARVDILRRDQILSTYDGPPIRNPSKRKGRVAQEGRPGQSPLPSRRCGGRSRDHPPYQLDSAPVGSAGTAISASTSAADTVTGAVGLISERVDVQEIDTETAPAGAAHAAITATAAVIAAHAFFHRNRSR